MSLTCTHVCDTGRMCKSFAVKGQRFCVHHLRYRARRLRMAQAAARGERFQFNLPPLESMHAVHSALSQLAEAIAHGVIDSRSARDLLSVLRIAARNLLHPEKWRDSLYESDQPAPDVDVAAEYGLPADLDLDTPPDVAFPPTPLSGLASATPPTPLSGDSASSADPFARLNIFERRTPFDLELEEIKQAQGWDAMLHRAHQWEKEDVRRERSAATRAAHQRFAQLAFYRNVESLAQKIADEQLAHLRSGQDSPPNRQFPPHLPPTPKPCQIQR